MRCSICLAELKEGPDGLECEACGTLLEPVENDAGEGNIARSQSARYVTIAVMVTAILAVAIFSWALVTFAPGQQQAGVEARSLSETAVTRAEALLIEDKSGIIARALRPMATASAVELIADKGCQAVSVDQAEAVHWINLVGESTSTFRPAFPGNWLLHQACPIDRGGAVFSTRLNEGVAISRVGQQGNVLWSQVVNVGNPKVDAIETVKEKRAIILIAHDDVARRVLIDSYDLDGRKNWSRMLNAEGLIGRFHIVKTGLGDFLVAWREQTDQVRLSIVSATGVVLQETLVDGVSNPVRTIVQNELGGTLLVLGEDDLSVQMLSSNGDKEWERSMARPALPLGVLGNESGFWVFAAENTSIFVWGFDQFGGRSNRLQLSFAEPIVAGKIRQINSVEGILTLSVEAGPPVDLVMDLRRLQNALIFEATDIASNLDAITQLAIDQADRLSATSDDNSTSAVNMAQLDAADSEEVSEDPLPVSQTASSILNSASQLGASSVQSQVSETIPATVDVSSSRVAVDSELSSSQDSANGVSSSTSNVTSAEPITQARCTFSCVSSDESAVEYVLLQTVDLNEGERLADVVLRMNDAHVTLCTVSGGEPVADFTRECVEG